MSNMLNCSTMKKAFPSNAGWLGCGLALFLVSVFAATEVAMAGQDLWPQPTEELILQQPGALRGTGSQLYGDGPQVDEIRLPSGVTYQVFREASGNRLLGVDKSGYGAVLCTWGYLSAALLTLELCPSLDSEGDTRGLKEIKESMDEFIVANSLPRLTRTEFDNRVDQWKISLMSQATSEGIESVCRGDFSGMILDLKKKGLESLRARVAKMVSVPRPPVIDPCGP